MFGATDRTRTGTSLKTTDFKSVAATNYATVAYSLYVNTPLVAMCLHIAVVIPTTYMLLIFKELVEQLLLTV